MKPSQQVRRAARIREQKRGVRQLRPKLLIDDVLQVLDRESKRADRLERELNDLKARLPYIAQ